MLKKTLPFNISYFCGFESLSIPLFCQVTQVHFFFFSLNLYGRTLEVESCSYIFLSDQHITCSNYYSICI